MMLPISRTFFLTHDDHLPHNTFASVARRCSDRLQLGMSDFLRRNPHHSEFSAKLRSESFCGKACEIGWRFGRGLNCRRDS
jgi:hypothetical protein